MRPKAGKKWRRNTLFTPPTLDLPVPPLNQTQPVDKLIQSTGMPLGTQRKEE